MSMRLGERLSAARHRQFVGRDSERAFFRSAAVLLVILYLGRLIILDANNLAIVAPALLAGFIINPAWYIWLGTLLRRE